VTRHGTVPRPPRLSLQPGSPDFLDLPWELPIDEWRHHRVVEMPTGIHRHPVRFVAYGEGLYAIKELPQRLGEREYRVLDTLQERTTRSARPAALVTRPWAHPQSEQATAVITRFVPHAFPYRNLVSGEGFGPRRNQMLDAIAGLLVELHLAGCFWGDCSLSNLLYRFDAGAIEAVMIDAETSSIYDELSDGQRRHDLEIMRENLAGEMADLAAAEGADLSHADLDLGEDVAIRYLGLWAELNQDLVITREEGYRIRERLARLNDLGFSVGDVVLEPGEDGSLVTMRTSVGGRTFNTSRLDELTGIAASENQARVILGDLHYFLARLEASTETERRVGAVRWLTESFQPMVARISAEWEGDDPVQGYTDLLHHRLEMAKRRGMDVSNEEAFASWAAAGFPGFPLGGGDHVEDVPEIAPILHGEGEGEGG
jgi:hypothetical protein